MYIDFLMMIFWLACYFLLLKCIHKKFRILFLCKVLEFPVKFPEFRDSLGISTNVMTPSHTLMRDLSELTFGTLIYFNRNR